MKLLGKKKGLRYLERLAEEDDQRRQAAREASYWTSRERRQMLDAARARREAEIHEQQAARAREVEEARQARKEKAREQEAESSRQQMEEYKAKRREHDDALARLRELRGMSADPAAAEDHQVRLIAAERRVASTDIQLRQVERAIGRRRSGGN